MRRWVQRKRPVWPRYLLLVLFLVACIVVIAYIIGTNLNNP
jgi:hypothetical protein